jgi:hypothetical protein
MVAPAAGGAGDRSDAPFRVVAPLSITYPNGGETLTIGRSVEIKYSNLSQATLDSLTAEISYDGGTTWAPADYSPGAGRLEWTVKGPAGSRARIRVTAKSAFGPPAVDQSDADFTIAP